MNNYYKVNEPIKAADIAAVDVAPSADAPVNAETADEHDTDVDAVVEFTPAAPVAVPKTQETARAPFQSSAAASSGFAAAAKSAPTSFAQSSTAPPNDFISFSAAPPKSARTRADMWETNPEPVGLGSGKSKVAVELSDDSDGELPEIHTGDDDDDDDDDDDGDGDGDEDEDDE